MINLADLESGFAERLVELITDARKIGINIIPIQGLISVNRQAVLWRQSRGDQEIDQAIGQLQEDKCFFLSDVLRTRASTFGPRVTDDLPGFSWFNFGEMVECEMIDMTSNEHIYDDALLNKELKKYFKKHDLSFGKDKISGNYLIRKSSFETPNKVYTKEDINQLMNNKWGDK